MQEHFYGLSASFVNQQGNIAGDVGGPAHSGVKLPALPNHTTNSHAVSNADKGIKKDPPKFFDGATDGVKVDTWLYLMTLHF